MTDTAPAPRTIDNWISEANRLGPYRVTPAGDLYVYADPQHADEDAPAAGVYVPAEAEIRRFLAREFQGEWTQARRNETLGFLKDISPQVFEDITEPLIPVLNGVVDLAEGEPSLFPHSSNYGFISQVPHVYDTHAGCPRIEEFLAEAVGEDVIPFIYELIGYTLLPFQFLRKAVMVTGPSGTGKSTLLFLLERLLGINNISSVPLQSFGEDKFAVSDLYGKLANIGGDIDATHIKATGVFKSLTGDDYVRADVKYGKPVRFRSGATCWFAANEIPTSSDHSDAWRTRWVILPFNNKPARQDFTLKSKLTTPEEMRGLLNHAIDGAARLLNRGYLAEPVEVREAIKKFVADTDHVQRFCDTLVEKKGGQFLSRPQVWEGYRLWTNEEGLPHTLGKHKLYQRIAERFGPTITIQGHTGWRVIQ